MNTSYKYIWALLLLLTAGVTTALAQNTYYFNPNGNDALDGLSPATAWKKMSAHVYNLPAGNHTWQFAPGTYQETVDVDLPAGVSLKGAGIGQTIFQTTSGTILNAYSSSPINGNQTVEGITFDGRGRLTSVGVKFQNRNNLTIRNVEAKDFNDHGMYVMGYQGAPITNILIENCIISNSARVSADVGGALIINNVNGAIIRNTTFNLSTSQAYGIKQQGGPYYNLKIYGCTFNMTTRITTGPYQGVPFAIELFRGSGSYGPNEIYNNTLNNGTLSLVGGDKGTGTINYKIYDNRIIQPEGPGFAWLEAACSDGEVYNNYITNPGEEGITISGTENAWDDQPRRNWTVHHNVIDGTATGNTYVPKFVNLKGNRNLAENIRIYNNTIAINQPDYRGVEIYIPVNNLEVRNNLFLYSNNVITVIDAGAVTFTNANVTNNRHAPGNWYQQWGTGSPVINASNNITSDPGLKLTGNKPAPYYEPAASSSAVVDAGTTAGLPAFAFQGNAPDIGAYEFSGTGTANQPPAVSLTSPTNGSTYSAPASISLSANASDANGTVSKVEFFQGTTKLGEDLTSPYSYSWTGVAAGTYSLSARATDNAGAVTTSSSVSVTVSSTAFTGREPENPATTLGGLNYKYYQGLWDVLPNFNALTPVKTGSVTNFDLSPRTVNDNFGFLYEGYVSVPSDGTYTFYTSSDDGSKLYIGSTEVVNNDGLHGAQERSGSLALKAGKHALRVVFFEQWGGELLEVRYQGPTIAKQLIPASALFRLPATSNQSPSVSLTSPANGATYTAPASISLSASASDADNTVSKVEFFQGTTKLGEDLTSPYSYSWTGVAAGTYSLSARATDNGGAVTTSSSVSVTVSAPTSSTALIDLSHGGGGYNSFGAPADEVKRYQTFLAGTNPRITSVEVKIRKYNGATQSNVTVELYATSANKPTGSPLASATIAASLVGTAGTVVSAPLSYSGLINGSKYAIVLGQQTPQGARYEWNVGAVSSSLEFGKYTGGTNYADESGLGDGWLKVYTSSSARLAAQRPAAIETIRVYPNPAREMVRIDGTGGQTVVHLLDLQGRLLRRSTGNEAIDLNVAQLPAGLYLLRIQSAAGIIIRRFTVQR